MARVFTVSFLYQEQDYTAVVTIREGNPGRSISIYVPDESLHPILPGGKISIDGRDGIPFDSMELTIVQDLMVSILAAIDVHEGHNGRIT